MSKDDPILINALLRAGHEAQIVLWDDPDVDWPSFDLALVRSTWDYFERGPEFLLWLDKVAKLVRLVNSAEILRWSFNKHYLLELAEAGVQVLPTEVADSAGVAAAVERVWQAGHSAIVKPVISGGSWGLHHLNRGEPVAPNPNQAPFLVQPFAPKVADMGELSVIMLGGEVSHGIRKFPKCGDIRVQAEFGGRYQVEEPSDAARELALHALGASPGQPVYARADMVERAGQLELMEIELLEPELFFAWVPSAADRLAELLTHR